MSASASKPFLLSIDLEDPRYSSVDGQSTPARVEQNCLVLLDYFSKHQLKTTFFVVGQIADEYPSLISEIIKRGHEIACHSHEHKHLTDMDQDQFSRDLENNLKSLAAAGATSVRGFRAPTFSLVQKSSWAYSVLKKHGITYSSSVLPAPNPLFSWPEFGQKPKKVDDVWEIPINFSEVGPQKIPYTGGIYFRLLPKAAILYFAKREKGSALVSYLHPYDIDLEQPRYMHGGIHGNRFYNWLMYQNRHTVFKKINALVSAGYPVMNYSTYIQERLK